MSASTNGSTIVNGIKTNSRSNLVSSSEVDKNSETDSRVSGRLKTVIEKEDQDEKPRSKIDLNDKGEISSR